MLYIIPLQCMYIANSQCRYTAFNLKLFKLKMRTEINFLHIYNHFSKGNERKERKKISKNWLRDGSVLLNKLVFRDNNDRIMGYFLTDILRFWRLRNLSPFTFTFLCKIYFGCNVM